MPLIVPIKPPALSLTDIDGQSIELRCKLLKLLSLLRRALNAAIITFGVVVVFGAWVSAMVRREFKLIPVGNLREWFTTPTVAVLVGVGSVLAMGCTVGHCFSGVVVHKLSGGVNRRKINKQRKQGIYFW